MTVKHIVIIGFLALLTVVSGACGGSGEEPISNDASIETPIANEVSIYEELLGLIPDTPENRFGLYINDYALACQVFDVFLPGPEADKALLLEYVRDLGITGESERAKATGVFAGPFISGLSEYYAKTLGMAKYLGFDNRNVDQSIFTGRLGSPEVARGRFDPTATEQMLSACSECPLPLLAEHQGISYYRWGEDSDQDLTRRFAPPAFDYLGRGGPLAVMEDYVFRTAEISEMQALIDSSLDIMPSLADAQEYALLAEGITELNLYSVFLSDQAQ